MKKVNIAGSNIKVKKTKVEALLAEINNQNLITKKKLGFDQIVQSNQLGLINKIVDVSILKYKYIYKKNAFEIHYDQYLGYINALTSTVITLFLKQEHLGLDEICSFHKAIFNVFSEEEKIKMKVNRSGELRREGRMTYNLNDEGKLRNRNYFVSANKVKKQLLGAIELYNKNKDFYSIVLFFNQSISKIHPFENGNGRVFFILLDVLLLKNGYLPLFINQDKTEYNNKIEEYFVTKNYNKLIIDFLELSLKKYTHYTIT